MIDCKHDLGEVEVYDPYPPTTVQQTCKKCGWVRSYIDSKYDCEHLNINRIPIEGTGWFDYKCIDCGIDLCICDDFDYNFHKSIDHKFDFDY